MLGVGYVLIYIFMVYTGKVNAKRLRGKYIQAVLPQHISFFDNVGAEETATRIQTDTREDEQCLFASTPIRFGSTYQKMLQSSSASF